MLVFLPLSGFVLMQSVWMLLLRPSVFRYWRHLWLKPEPFTFDGVGSRGQAAPAQLNMWGQQWLHQTLLGGGRLWSIWACEYVCTCAISHGSTRKGLKEWSWALLTLSVPDKGGKWRRRGEGSEQHHLLGESRACYLPATTCAWPQS